MSDPAAYFKELRTRMGSNFYYNSSDIGKSISSGYAPVYQQDVTNGAHIWFKTNNASTADETISLSEDAYRQFW